MIMIININTNINNIIIFHIGIPTHQLHSLHHHLLIQDHPSASDCTESPRESFHLILGFFPPLHSRGHTSVQVRS